MRSKSMSNDEEKAEIPRFGKLIRQARKTKSWSQPRLAEKMGVDTKTIRRWEAKSVKPQKSSRDQLSKILDISPEELEQTLISSPIPEEKNLHGNQIPTPNEQHIYPTPTPVLSQTHFIHPRPSTLLLVSTFLTLY